MRLSKPILGSAGLGIIRKASILFARRQKVAGMRTYFAWKESFACRLLLAAAAAACSPVASHASDEPKPAILRGAAGIEASFAQTRQGYHWIGYRDTAAKQDWSIAGPRLSLVVADHGQTNFAQTGFNQLTMGDNQAVLETSLSELSLDVRQVFSFCADGRTLRIQTFLRSRPSPGRNNPVVLEQAGLLELEVAGENFRLMGPDWVSSPIFGDGVFAGIEHPSAFCRARGKALWLAQHPFLAVTREWTGLPAAVFGSCSGADRQLAGAEAMRRAFLNYLETVRVKPKDMHVHYNDWWTAPVPSSEQFVLRNLAELKKGLYDPTGFFFDSYALDAGWSNPKSVWEMDTNHFPQRFAPLRAALEQMGGHVGLWISPSSLYPFALDNGWLESAGYEVTPLRGFGANACLAKGGRYQRDFAKAALDYAREARLAHMKFDGYIARCDVAGHGHKTGLDSCLPLAEGLMEVFDRLRALNPDIALEPTCFGYQPSPWWLMHVPYIIGPFGDDSPYGRCPAPDYLESMTTAREIKNLRGRGSFLMPSAALQCFDIIMQCPGAFQNHAAMAVGRGRWFISSYINPKFMDAEAWRFFADLMGWARHNREFLREPLPFGGDPERRQAYGYAFLGESRQVYCLRNPWIEETNLSLLKPFASTRNLEVRMLYPRRGLLARLAPGEPLPDSRLGPYETQFIEVTATSQPPAKSPPRPEPSVRWQPTREPRLEHLVFDDTPAPFGPDWTSPDGGQKDLLRFTAEGGLRAATESQVCVLCEGEIGVAQNRCKIMIDGQDVPVAVSRSQGSFGAAGEGFLEHWIWFLATVPAGEHHLRIETEGSAITLPMGIYLRGDVPAPPAPAPFDGGPAFPLYRPERLPWSRVLVPLAARAPDPAATKKAPRRIVTIHGIFLDSLDWSEAAAGWGKVQRNRSIMEKPMTLAGKMFHRGLGAHAASRVRFALPAGYATFAATLGKDQEVAGGSVVFAVQLDGREVFRSGVFRNDTAPREIALPLGAAKELVLRVEDAGDGIGADHADWADARLLK